MIVTRAEYSRRTPFPIAGAVLVVEVVSPTSVLRDTETKRALYARAGVPSYWIVVPAEDKPTLTLAELRLDAASGHYRYAVHYSSEVFETDQPWPLRLDLPALSEKRRKLTRSLG